MTSVSIPLTVEQERLFPTLAAAGILTWLGDFLFWHQPPGLSVALFALSAAAALYALPGSERPSRAAWIAALLLLISCVATYLEVSFSNTAVLGALLAVLMGERHFSNLSAGWTRWSEPLIAWACAGGRWPWLMRAFGRSELANVGFNSITSDRSARLFQIVAPAAGLAVVFGVVLGFGNALFRQLLVHFELVVVDWISSFEFSPVRIVQWAVFATFALALVRPRLGPNAPRLWTRPVPQLVRGDAGLAIWQSCAIFVTLNVLFFIVNSIDVIYLWGQDSAAALPQNVSFSAFVHQGVYSLIFAVLLSAVVIVAIFQQETRVTGHPVLKGLAWAWIAQNLLLIAGVVLRLKLYVDAYQLSELRVYVGCFLLLVTAGFVLLALHVARSGTLGALLWRNVLATFTLFFVLQFPNVSGRVARFNVAQWQRDATRTLDLAYLESMGPSAWPALCDVASSDAKQNGTVRGAQEIVRRLARTESEQEQLRDWPSYQARRTAHLGRLHAEAARPEQFN